MIQGKLLNPSSCYAGSKTQSTFTPMKIGKCNFEQVDVKPIPRKSQFSSSLFAVPYRTLSSTGQPSDNSVVLSRSCPWTCSHLILGQVVLRCVHRSLSMIAR